jgi:hypothetical protein
MAVATMTKHRRHHETGFFRLSMLGFIFMYSIIYMYTSILLEKGSDPKINAIL